MGRNTVKIIGRYFVINFWLDLETVENYIYAQKTDTITAGRGVSIVLGSFSSDVDLRHNDFIQFIRITKLSKLTLLTSDHLFQIKYILYLNEICDKSYIYLSMLVHIL